MSGVGIDITPYVFHMLMRCIVDSSMPHTKFCFSRDNGDILLTQQILLYLIPSKHVTHDRSRDHLPKVTRSQAEPQQ